MNSDSNSDLEQCTESKLGRVHSAHTHGPGCAQAVSALLCVLASVGPYRGPLPCRVAPVPGHVVGRKRVLAHRVTALCRAHGRALSQPFRPYHAPPAPYRGTCLAVSRAFCAVSWRMLGRITALLRAVSQPVSRYT